MSLKKWVLRTVAAVGAAILGAIPVIAFAHENYVLPKSEIDAGMMDWNLNVWNSLKTPGNLAIAAKFGAGFLAFWIIYFFFQRSKWGVKFDRWIQKGESFGDVLLRVVLGISLLFSAHLGVFLGPEIPFGSIPGGQYFTIALYISGTLMVLGLFSRIAGAGAMVAILLATFVYKDYMLTYFNYFGEFVALAVFGSYIFSIDRLRSAKKEIAHKVRQWEALILRVTYGISILYPAISIKLLHPIIIIEIAKQYHLTDIAWLFPPDPLLISLGTGLTQVAVGLALIVGFETRLNSLITFTLYVMSIAFFKEAVWPHYILLALAAYLFINGGGDWTLDALLKKKRTGRV
jgi:uncharacterized membrane protein YphA (DoxX/SURF4 family)